MKISESDEASQFEVGSESEIYQMLKKYKQFEQLVDKNKYQIFLMSCPAFSPINFAWHPYFVINKKGILSRWEVHYRKNLSQTSWGHLYLNAFIESPFQGIKMFSFSKKYYWKPKLVVLIEDDKNSIASKIIDTIETSAANYPFCYKYALLGPNSNTYVQWVLNKFPELPVKLSWRYIGKDFIKK